MDNVKALRTKDVSPRIVLNSVMQQADKFEQIYIVGFTKEEGPQIWASGDLSDLCVAAKVLDNLATKYINGEIEEE